MSCYWHSLLVFFKGLVGSFLNLGFYPLLLSDNMHRYQHLGSMMSLGQLNAAVALPFALPRPLEASIAGSPLGPLLDAAGIKVGGGATSDSGVTLEGPLAAVLRRVAYLYRQPTNEQRLNVASSWVQQALSVVTNTGAPKS